MKIFTRHTPWGHADHVKVIAPGIMHVSTPSHGGLWLSQERTELLRKLFPTFNGYAGLPWLEEDQDWAVDAVVFPQDFDVRSVYYACRTITGLRLNSRPATGSHYMRPIYDWLMSPAGEPARAIADTYTPTE